MSEKGKRLLDLICELEQLGHTGTSVDRARLDAIIEGLDQFDNEKVAELIRPRVGRTVQQLIELIIGGSLSPQDEATSTNRLETIRTQLSALRDGGLAVEDIARMFGMTESGLRAFLDPKPVA